MMAKDVPEKIEIQKESKPREIPEYKKPYAEFIRKVEIGDQVKIEIRQRGEKGVYLEETTGKIVDTMTNAFRWFDDGTKKERGKPWWAVHNWEILDD